MTRSTTFYHATTPDRAEQIREQGLVPTEDNYGKGQQRVYFSDRPSQYQWTREVAFSTRNREDRQESDNWPVAVVEFDAGDEYDLEDSDLTMGGIEDAREAWSTTGFPKESILNIHQFEDEGEVFQWAYDQ